MKKNQTKMLLAMAPAVCAMCIPAYAGHPKNIIERHPTMTGIAAGAGVHHLLKSKAAYDKAHGKKLNFAERHPTMMGLGAAWATHHEIKKHTPK